MAGLRRYSEWLSRGRRPGRIAYVLKEWNLPKPVPGAEWRHDRTFNAAEEVLADPRLKDDLKAAIENGVAVVSRSEK